MDEVADRAPSSCLEEEGEVVLLAKASLAIHLQIAAAPCLRIDTHAKCFA